MLSSFVLGALVWPLAAQAASSAAADGATATACNPLHTSGCSADPALATSIRDRFDSASDNYDNYRTPSRISYNDDGVTFTLAERFDNPSLISNFYIMFGRTEVHLRAARGTGVISSFYLQSDDNDEIDLEWFGGDAYEVQTNFFSKGNTSTYDRGEYHRIADPREDFHNYTIDWTPSALRWYFDGELMRVLYNDSASGYPQTPMRVYMGIWAGGDSSNGQGVIEWAGGMTDYSDAPFRMEINSLTVADYSTGDSYSYSDRTGEWESIHARNGRVMGRAGDAGYVSDSSNRRTTTYMISANTAPIRGSATEEGDHATSACRQCETSVVIGSGIGGEDTTNGINTNEITTTHHRSHTTTNAITPCVTTVYVSNGVSHTAQSCQTTLVVSAEITSNSEGEETTIIISPSVSETAAHATGSSGYAPGAAAGFASNGASESAAEGYQTYATNYTDNSSTSSSNSVSGSISTTVNGAMAIFDPRAELNGLASVAAALIFFFSMW